jgi:hypothetical protein
LARSKRTCNVGRINGERILSCFQHGSTLETDLWDGVGLKMLALVAFEDRSRSIEIRD